MCKRLGGIISVSIGPLVPFKASRTARCSLHHYTEMTILLYIYINVPFKASRPYQRTPRFLNKNSMMPQLLRQASMRASLRQSAPCAYCLLQRWETRMKCRIAIRNYINKEGPQRKGGEPRHSLYFGWTNVSLNPPCPAPQLMSKTLQSNSKSNRCFVYGSPMTPPTAPYMALWAFSGLIILF